jgi:hypothetical protein
MRHSYLFVVLSAVALSGCESTAVEDNFGKAVTQMKRAQTNNPATLTGSQDKPVEGIDAEAATVAISSLRKDTPERAAVKRDILINVGTQSGGGSQ